MAEDRQDISALVKALADSPRRDNSTYHSAMAKARDAFARAEGELGGPVDVRTRTKVKRNGDYVVKFTFSRVR